MEAPAEDDRRISAVQWVRVCTIGWFLGFITMVPMLMLGSVLGEPQSTVPIGLGLGIAWWQSRYLKRVQVPPARWVWTTVVALGAPFALWDVTNALDVNVFFSLATCGVVAALLVGVAQAPMLASRERRVIWWGASAVGWSLPVLCTQLTGAEFLPTAVRNVIGLVGIFFGGPMLGAATGKPLVSLLRSR